MLQQVGTHKAMTMLVLVHLGLKVDIPLTFSM
jgi:hypothetical protein